jgi:hypothetical protein
MDVMHQGQRPQPMNHQVPENNFMSTQHSPKKDKKNIWKVSNLTNTLIVFIGLLVAISVFAIVFYKTTNETNYVDTSTYQAVFVNVAGSSGGQAYFGHITDITSNYIVLNNVFYLQPGSTSNQFTLNNLNCAVYTPNDQMVIYRPQVAFWENLSSKSQVVSDINKWDSENLQCSKSSTASSSTSSTNNSSTSTSSTSTSSTTKK